MAHPVRIAPSILSADFARLGEEIRAMDEAGADWIHVDVMDGHFVPNISIGPAVVKAIRPHTQKPLDVHLMISPVDAYLDAFAEAGADTLTVHPEAGPHIHRSLQHIKYLGKRAGVVLNPGTPAKMLDYLLDQVDLVLVMSVNPGFGGQSFIESQLKKIAAIRKMIDQSGRPIDLEVDGGVVPETARQCIEAGADALVAGTAAFRGGPSQYSANIAALRARPQVSDPHDDLPDDDEFAGKRLVRTNDRGLSLGERLAERLNRLTWRTPLHAMRLRGKHPLKLIAVPDDPFAGDPARGQALMTGRFAYRGDSVDADSFANVPLAHPISDYIHGFAWLRDLSGVAKRLEAAPVAEAAMRQWLAANADKVGQPAWRGDLVGRRLQMWAAHAPLILSSADLVYRSKVLNTLARQARHLERTADKVAPGAPRVMAWAGALTAALLIPGGDGKRGAIEAALAKALDGAVFPDGGVVARTPQVQLDLIMTLTLLTEAYRARRLDPADAIRSTLGRMVPALLGICHGDRGLSSWQGSGPVSGAVVAEAVTASGVRARPMRQTRDWGYQRLSGAATVVIMDAAPPPVARLIAGGCASTLAFEMSDGANRIIVNCGGARAASARLPAALVEGLRTTAAHSTLIVGDSNSTAIHADGTLGRGVVEVELSRQEIDTATRVEASHDGYVRRFGFVHRRQLALASDGRELRGEDMLLPAGKRRPGDTPFAIRFHLAPGIRVSPTADGLAALLRLQGGPVWQFRCRGAALTVDDSLWIDGDGRPQPAQQLVLTASASAGGASVGWALRRAH